MGRGEQGNSHPIINDWGGGFQPGEGGS
jgi:hypothetical protein